MGWKQKMLSMADRSNFIKSVNAAIPDYVRQCHLLPKSINLTLDQCNRNFLWGSSYERRKIHSLRWAEAHEPNSLWARILKINTPRCPVDVDPSPIWRGIRKTQQALEEATKIGIRSGQDTSFWLHDWLGVGPLRHMIQGPLLPQDTSLTVREAWNQGAWALNNFSMSLPSQILDLLSTIHPQWFNPQPDCLVWKLNPHGQFTSKSALTLLDRPHHPFLLIIGAGFGRLGPILGSYSSSGLQCSSVLRLRICFVGDAFVTLPLVRLVTMNAKQHSLPCGIVPVLNILG
ncbi:hypothetical protein Acr_13g0005140 [Actinidia rufa]|uniref:Uncharacterized protein n=1 Tax=Actinidia rufa TaxID=165716 RepID=A0A7J0FKK5_9ERIC|nr:hypothetical protein Acr_13g0005140 [Actinidia rufa]